VPLIALPLGAVHVPPVCGLPLSEALKATGAPVLHTVKGVPEPGLLAVVMLTVTVALALEQGGVPVIVYV
jgi:hypothetical protein